MADVDGTLINTDTGESAPTATFDPLSEPADGVEVSNSTSAGGGGGATIVRQNPELTRTNP